MPIGLDDLAGEIDRDLATRQEDPRANGGDTASPIGSGASGDTTAASSSSAGTDAPPSATRSPVSASLREVGITGPEASGVAGTWWKGMSEAVENYVNPKPSTTPQTTAQAGVAGFRAAQSVINNAFAVLSLPQDMLNVGFANLTAPLAALAPGMPAATITGLYVGVPHAHSHPPSLVPPAPPVPLPSLGAITLGTCVRVLINGMPAARCGDIGLAPTCGGIVPFFQIKTGSSNTFIGGNRAARLTDISQACSRADDRETADAGKIMGMIGAAARAAQTAMQVGAVAVGVMGVAADAAEAATEDDAAMSSAKATAAAMGAAQMAADLAAAAMTKTMGKDPGIPPVSVGAVTLGHPNVLIGGFPMVNIPNPAELILKKLSRYKRRPPQGSRKPGHCGTPDCD